MQSQIAPIPIENSVSCSGGVFPGCVLEIGRGTPSDTEGVPIDDGQRTVDRIREVKQGLLFQAAIGFSFFPIVHLDPLIFNRIVVNVR